MAFLYGISDHPYLQKLKGDVFSTVFPRAAVPGLAFLGLCLLVMLGATRTVDWYSQTLACSVVAPWLDVLAFLVSLLGNPIITGGVAMVLAVRGWQSRGKPGLMPLLLFVGVAIEAVLKFVLPHPGPPPEFSHPLTLPPILHTMIAPFQLHLKTPYSFPGALVLVTHDRFLLDRVSTILLALDGNGQGLFYADSTQWETAQKETVIEASTPAPKQSPRDSKRTPRLTSQEKREWEQMEAKILAAEEIVSDCQRELDDPSVAANPVVLQERYQALEMARAAVEQLYTRWAELEEKQK